MLVCKRGDLSARGVRYSSEGEVPAKDVRIFSEVSCLLGVSVSSVSSLLWRVEKAGGSQVLFGRV